MKTLIIAALSLFAATASAEPRLPRAAIAAGLDVLKPVKVAKPVVCQRFERAGAFGVCLPTKLGGKPALFRSFTVVTLADPSTGEPVQVMVGFK